MKPKYSPIPWVFGHAKSKHDGIDATTIFDANGHPVAVVWSRGKATRPNGHLISASAELLKAGQNLRAGFRSKLTPFQMEQLLKAMERSIAKANGKIK